MDPFDNMPEDVQADYERLSAGGQTPAVLLGPASGSHSDEQLAKVQEVRTGIGLAPLSPFEAWVFTHGTPGGGEGPGTKHPWNDPDFAMDAPGGHGSDQGQQVHASDRSSDFGAGFGGFLAPIIVQQSTPMAGAPSSGAVLIDHGLGAGPPAQLVEAFRQMQQTDLNGTNTAFVIDMWCLMDSGQPGTPVTTGIRKAWGRVNFPCKLIGYTVLADPPGNVTIDIQKTDYATFPTFASITGATAPSIGGGSKTENASLLTSDWTVLLSRGDIIRIDLPANSASDLIFVDLSAVRTDATDKTRSQTQ